MATTTFRRIIAGALLGFVLINAPVWAQLAVEPQALSVSVPQYATETPTVTLTNTGSDVLSFCVNFDRPLQQEGPVWRLSERVGAEPCGPYGEVLYHYDEEDLENDTDKGGWGPYTISMTPEGRLFTAESGGLDRTFELTPDLQYVGSFVHPIVADLTPFSSTWGITYDTESGTLWWMNGERTGGSNAQTRRVLLLEGDLGGEETGRQIQLVLPEGTLEDLLPRGLAYDPATDRFYFSATHGNSSDPENWRLWTVDRTGTVPEGYPLRPEPYPDGLLGPPDAHGGAGGGPEGVRIEYGAYPPFGPGRDRVVVVDRWGNTQGEALETPVPDVLFEGGGAGIRGNPLRSRIDPNGVMYMTFTNFEHTGIVGVRPHPLPPSWLMVDSDEGPEAAWDGTLAPGESREIVLTFRAGAREVGDYTSSLQVFEAESGAAVEVPLTLSVTLGVDAEESLESERETRLSVYPNPSFGEATVTLTLAEASEVRVAVYDVLGREVAVLHEGSMAAGERALAFETARLRPGVYVLRFVTPTGTQTRKLTVIR